MIVRARPHWLRLFFSIRGSMLPKIAPQMLLATAFAVAVTALHGKLFFWKVPLDIVQWSLIAFVHALRHRLRRTDARTDLERLLPAEDCRRLSAVRNAPAVLLQLCGEWLRDRRLDGTLNPAIAPVLEAQLAQLTEVQGGCERIAGTPLPFARSGIFHRTVCLYCVLLPFALVDVTGLMTPVVVAFVAYTFLAMEALGAELEEPFGMAPNDLALDAMAWGIEATLRETIGAGDLPPAPPIVDFIRT